MEIKPIPEIIKEIDILTKEEKYDEAYEYAKENVSLNKEYNEGEYVFKNLLEELLFQVSFKREVKLKIPQILDYSSLYSNYGKILLHFNEVDSALKSFNLSNSYNPVNVSALFGLASISKAKGDWEEYHKLTVQTFKFDYYREDLAKSFRNLSFYYLNQLSKNPNQDGDDLKITVALKRMAEEYDAESKLAIDELDELNKLISNFNTANSNSNFNSDDLVNQCNDLSIDEIKAYLKSKGLPNSPSVEVITICKNLGFQLDESKKVVPALFYFNIAYDLTHDSAIKDVIDDLNQKVEKKLNE